MLLLQDTASSPTHSSYLQYNLALIRCSDVTRGLSWGKTQLKGAHWLTLRKQLRNNTNPLLNGYTKTRNHRKTLRKKQKNNTLLKPKECKYQNTTQVGARFLHLDWQGGGRFAPLPPVSYATDQVQFKHEQPKVLLIKSHITIGTIQQTQYAASVL